MTDGGRSLEQMSTTSKIRPRVIRRHVPDVEVQRLLVQLSAAKLRRSELTVSRLRRDWQLCVKVFATRDDVADVQSVTIDAEDGRRIPLRVYDGTGLAGPKPIIVWFHGGGFVMGDLYTAAATCRAIARRTGALVVAVQYRLVPEHSLESQIDDCHTATEWVSEHAPGDRRRPRADQYRRRFRGWACWPHWLHSGGTGIGRRARRRRSSSIPQPTSPGRISDGRRGTP